MAKAEQCWYLENGKCLYEPPEGFYGFVYKIINLQNGRIYIGKKAFNHRKKTKLSKKARQGTRKRTKVEYIDSAWLSYYGSSKELLADVKLLGEENFKRIVLHFCKNSSTLSYMEVHEQIMNNVLLTPNSYNSWIGCRIFKKHL